MPSALTNNVDLLLMEGKERTSDFHPFSFAKDWFYRRLLSMSFFWLFLFLKHIYLFFERERERERERGREGGRERGRERGKENPKQSPSYQCRA